MIETRNSSIVPTVSRLAVYNNSFWFVVTSLIEIAHLDRLSFMIHNVIHFLMKRANPLVFQLLLNCSMVY